MIFTRFATAGRRRPADDPAQESERFDMREKWPSSSARPAAAFARDGAGPHVAGYACYNDGSIATAAATLAIRAGKNFCRHRRIRAVDVTTDEIPDISKQTMRPASTASKYRRADLDLVFDVPALIAYCSLHRARPGDVIVTGTTGGVGAYRTPPLWMKTATWSRSRSPASACCVTRSRMKPVAAATRAA